METEGGTKRGRGRGRGSTRGRAASTRARGSRGRGRGRKAKINFESDEEILPEQNEVENVAVIDPPTKEEEVQSTEIVMVAVSNINPSEPLLLPAEDKENEIIIPPTIDMEADISQLEAPTFTTISRGPPEPMLRLKWDHKVSLIGEKVMNPMIHCCDQCDKPILIYGRMIPCKHVFCLRCARIIEPFKSCPRCKEKVLRVEQSGLGTVFMCTHGGSRYGNTGCRRTYLSQRDLQAHINHRHETKLSTQRKGSISSDSIMPSPNASAPPMCSSQSSIPTSITSASSSYYYQSQHYSNVQSRNRKDL